MNCTPSGKTTLYCVLFERNDLLFSRETSNVAFINEVEVDGDVTVYFVLRSSSF